MDLRRSPKPTAPLITYRAELEPKFYSDVTSFQVTLFNLNYAQMTENTGEPSIEEQKPLIDPQKPSIDPQKPSIGDDVTVNGTPKQLFAQRVCALNLHRAVKEKIQTLFDAIGYEQPFGRSDVMRITGLGISAAGDLINKMKAAGLIQAVSGHGKGKYTFTQE